MPILRTEPRSDASDHHFFVNLSPSTEGLEQIATYSLAMRAAVEASKAIMHLYNTNFQTEWKGDGSPVTEADLASSHVISSLLDSTNIPILGEETEHQSFELREQWTLNWCVDPLDGTKEFIQRNGEFAVNIALIENGKPIFGIIASPVQQKMLVGGMDWGVYFLSFSELDVPENWQRLSASSAVNSPLVMASSRSHHSGSTLDYLNELRTQFGSVDFQKKGSSLKFFDLALGTSDVYPRFAPTMEWDIAPGQAILEALGGAVVHAVTNEPLTYNKRNLKNPYFVAKTAAFLQTTKREPQ